MQVALGNSSEPSILAPSNLAETLGLSPGCRLDVFSTLFRDPGSTTGIFAPFPGMCAPPPFPSPSLFSIFRNSTMRTAALDAGSVIDFTLRDPNGCATNAGRLADGTLVLDNLDDPLILAFVVTTNAPAFQQFPGRWNQTLARPGCLPVGSADCLGMLAAAVAAVAPTLYLCHTPHAFC
jgi:hypothetical protein